MNRSTRTNGMIASALCGLIACAGAAQGQSGDELILSGQIWDFQASHPDFGLSSTGGGEVSGLLDYYLVGNAAAYLGTGTQHTQDTLDAGGNEIAPHLFADTEGSTGVFVLTSEAVSDNAAVTDSYDPSIGYSASDAEPLPDLDTVAAIPSVSAPAMSVPKQASVRYRNDGTFTITSGDIWADSFEVLNNTTVVIDGTVRIRADANFRIRNGCTIYLTPGSDLEIWVGGTTTFQQHTSINEDLPNALLFDAADDTPNWDHTNVRMYNFGTDTIFFDNATDFKGTVLSPDAPVEVSNDGQFYGALTASGASVDNTSGIHIAGEFTWVNDCWNAGDTQQAVGNSDAGRITSPLSFAQWFRDVPGVNLQDTEQLLLTKVGSSYVFDESDWRPIDGELYNSAVSGPNRNFTVSLQSIFLNDNCEGNYLEIETSMDAWVFINDVMVIDLGGTTGVNTQRIDLDRLGLGTNEWCRLRVLIAARVDGPQPLRIDTTIPLTAPRNYLVRAEPGHD